MRTSEGVVDVTTRIERALTTALEPPVDEAGCPPGLAAAVRHAVFPAGARIRPRLTLAVARACGDPDAPLVDAAAAAIELLHCASLVHDDLPCFDDAPLRRGRPSVHAAYGERLAVLAGDALIVLAFDVLARHGTGTPARLPAVLGAVARGVGMRGGIVAGQGWECEPCVPLSEYHREKTGALFAAATAAGAAAAGHDPRAWAPLGDRLGEAYQVADDLRDAVGDAESLGKPVGRDAALGRPSAVAELGLDGALARVRRLVGDAVDAVPPCAGADDLRAHVLGEAARLVPRRFARPAA
jgi:geranylgeranyl diphosphate synthase type II